MSTADTSQVRGRPPGRTWGPDEREALTSVATRLFAESGFESTSMQDIASGVGLQAASLYKHVESKQHLLDQILLRGADEMLDRLRAGLSVADDPAERVRRGMEEQVRYRLNHAATFIVMTREGLNSSPRVLETIVELREAQYRAWREVIEEGVHRALFDTPSSELSARVLNAMCNYVEIQDLWLNKAIPEAHLIIWYAEFALRTLQVRGRSRLSRGKG